MGFAKLNMDICSLGDPRECGGGEFMILDQGGLLGGFMAYYGSGTNTWMAELEKGIAWWPVNSHYAAADKYHGWNWFPTVG